MARFLQNPRETRTSQCCDGSLPDPLTRRLFILPASRHAQEADLILVYRISQLPILEQCRIGIQATRKAG